MKSFNYFIDNWVVRNDSCSLEIMYLKHSFENCKLKPAFLVYMITLIGVSKCVIRSLYMASAIVSAFMSLTGNTSSQLKKR